MSFQVKKHFTLEESETGPDILSAKYFLGTSEALVLLSDHIFENSHYMIFTHWNAQISDFCFL